MQRTRTHNSAAYRFALVSVFGSLAVTITSCGPGDAPAGWGVHEHADMAIAATGDGRLAVEYDFAEEVELGTPVCIGGSGDDCLGGLLLFSSEAPGFGALEQDEPAESLFALAEGVTVTLELTDHSPEASFFLNGVSLNDAGESVVLGESLEGLHVHGEFQVVLPGGAEPAESYYLTFKLSAADSLYGDSDEYTLTLHAHHEDE